MQKHHVGFPCLVDNDCFPASNAIGRSLLLVASWQVPFNRPVLQIETSLEAQAAWLDENVHDLHAFLGLVDLVSAVKAGQAAGGTALCNSCVLPLRTICLVAR